MSSGYTAKNKYDVLVIHSPVQISGSTNFYGPLTPYDGEVVGFAVASPTNTMADDADNNFLVEAKINAVTVANINTGVTDVPAGTTAGAIVTGTNARFEKDKAVVIQVTEENTAVNIAPWATFNISGPPGIPSSANMF